MLSSKIIYISKIIKIDKSNFALTLYLFEDLQISPYRSSPSLSIQSFLQLNFSILISKLQIQNPPSSCTNNKFDRASTHFYTPIRQFVGAGARVLVSPTDSRESRIRDRSAIPRAKSVGGGGKNEVFSPAQTCLLVICKFDRRISLLQIRGRPRRGRKRERERDRARRRRVIFVKLATRRGNNTLAITAAGYQDARERSRARSAKSVASNLTGEHSE